ncbi:MAG TPA: ChbG/HpnK family deacetylase [Anaerolineae bacterium]|nr:ChbG/HpnK family deacetylase [Anaerolineae bacterium]
MTKVLIVNADDYGRSLVVSSGIREAHLSGLVTTTTVMMNLPGAIDEIGRAREECPSLGIGVHLNLSVGPPCAPVEKVRSLLDPNDRFLDRTTIIQSPDRLDPVQLEIELRAQVEAFLTTGTSLDHLDSHNHIVALNPKLWEIYLSLAEEYGCGVRPSFPSDVPKEILVGIYPPYALDFASQGAMDRLESTGVRYPGRFLASFFGPGATLDNLLYLINNLEPGVSELMCHPGHFDETLSAESGYVREREEELSILIRPKARKAIEHSDIRLATYRDAWNPPPGSY